MTQLLRVQNFNVSRTASAPVRTRASSARSATPTPATCSPGPVATASWPNRTDPGGSRGLDDYFTRDFDHNIGAEIMGRNKFGPQRGPWETRTGRAGGATSRRSTRRCSCMTHHVRPSFTLPTPRSTSSTATRPTVLEQAREAAEGKDVRLGGGAHDSAQFLDADLVDTLHVAVAPVEFGSGVRLWDSPDELLDRFHLDVVPSPSGVTHHLFWTK